MRGKTTYPFPNFNGAGVEIWEWISNFAQHISVDVKIYPRINISWNQFKKEEVNIVLGYTAVLSRF